MLNGITISIQYSSKIIIVSTVALFLQYSQLITEDSSFWKSWPNIHDLACVFHSRLSLLWEMRISKSRLLSSSEHLFSVIIWPIFEKPRSTTTSMFGTRRWIINKRRTFGNTYSRTISRRSSSTRKGFSMLVFLNALILFQAYQSIFLLRICHLFSTPIYF